MQDNSDDIQGIWLPLVTPFRDGQVDEPSLRRLLHHYLGEPVLLDNLDLEGMLG